MPRRIEKLDFRREHARAKVQETTKQMSSCTKRAKEKVVECIGTMIQALQDRQNVLLMEIDELANSKKRMLEDQVERSEQYDRQDQESLRLRTDEVVDFHPKKMKEMLESMTNFGEVDGTSTYASESSVAGPLIEGPVKVGNQTWMVIKAADLYGQQKKEGGDTIDVQFSSKDDMPPSFSWELKDLEDGSYKLSVTPEAVGSYAVSVSIKNRDDDEFEPVAGSPFPVQSQAPFDYSTFGGDPQDQAGSPWIEAKDGSTLHPIGVQFDPQSEFVFVADQNNHCLQALEYATKEFVCAFGKKGTGSQHFQSPGFIVVDRENRIIVSDILNHRLQVIHFNRKTRVLSHVRSIGCAGTTAGKFSFPRGLTLTHTGLLLVCDSGNNRVQVFDSNNDFAFVREFGEHGVEEGKLDRPVDLAANNKEEIYVTDDQHRVQVFDVKGEFIRCFGKKGKKNGQFRHPTCITIDDEDGVFVADQDNARVQVFTSNGTFVHKWGGEKKKVEPQEDDADPDAEATEVAAENAWSGLMGPAGVAVSAAGTVLVSDFKKRVVFSYSCCPKQSRSGNEGGA